MKKMTVATVITTVVMVAYAACLWAIEVPAEKAITVFLEDVWVIPLPFTVSAWWGLLVFPLALFYTTYVVNFETIVGKKPRGKQIKENKYGPRQLVHLVRVLAGFFFAGMILIMTFLQPFWTVTAGIDNSLSFGPLSSLASGALVYLIVYVLGGFCLQAIFTLLWNTLLDEDAEEETDVLVDRFSETHVNLVKMGVISTLPFQVGMALGFMVRLVIAGFKLVFTKIGSISISFSK